MSHDHFAPNIIATSLSRFPLRYSLVVLLCLGLRSPLVALQHHSAKRLPPPSNDYVIKNWSVKDGLPESSITCFEQTNDGYLWIGTWNGLARFDGLHFTSFHSGNTDALETSNINVLMQDSKGVLWIGVKGGGLVRYKRGTFAREGTDGDLRNASVDALEEDDDGRLWIGTDNGLYVMENDSIRLFEGADRPFKGPVSGICATSDGNMWINEVDSLFCLSSANGRFTVTRKLRVKPVGIAEDSRGRIWYADLSGVLHARDGMRERTYAQFADLPLTSLTPLRNGGIGVCCLNCVVLVYDDTIVNLESAEGVRLLVNEHIFEDREGNIWLGRASSGLFRLRRRNVSVFGPQQGLSSEIATTTVEDTHGTLWVGTYRSGLNYFAQGAFHHYVRDLIDPTLDIYSMLASTDGTLWVAALGHGLVSVRGDRAERYTCGIIAPSTSVSVLAQGKDHSLWVGTKYEGAQCIQGGTVTVWDTAKGLSSDDISCILPARNGDTWIGTVSKGVNRISNGTVSVIGEDKGLSSNEIQTMIEDDDGGIWIATRRGLNRWKKGTIVRMGEDDGLPDDAIAEMVDDGRGNFWCGGIKGIFRVSKKQLNSVANGSESYIQCNLYGVEDGMVVSEVGGQGKPNVCRDRHGVLWFASERGLLRIDPRSVHDNAVPPEAIVEQVSVEHKPVRTDTTVVVQPGDSRIEFDYTGISFHSPSNVRFQYRLVGLGEDWQEAGSNRYVQYTHLPPGDYTFQVKAQNSDGIWSTRAASIAMVVLPPFWRTPWFLALMITFFLVSGPTVYMLRVRSLKREHQRQLNFSRMLIERQEEERKRISREMHDSVGQELLILKHQLQLNLREQSLSDELKKTLEEQSAAASNIITEVRTISHNLRPPELDRLGVTETIRALLQRVRNTQKLVVKGEIDEIDGFFRKEDEINMIRIIQEAMNNIMKHAEATSATITVSLAGDRLDVSIADNGKGMSKPANGSPGLGMNDIQERVELLEGTMNIESLPEHGTTLNFTFSRKNAHG
jgi:signal transduction histidine kinase/ligand-binding sensor domain-containing protein